MIDMDDESRQAVRMIGSFLLFLIASIFAFGEIKYLVWGHKADATVTRTFPTSEGRASQRLAVEYTFTDEKLGPLSERDDVPDSFEVEPGPIKVEYLPGVRDSSRVDGNSRMGAVWFCLSSMLWVGWNLFALWREAQEPVGGRKKRRR